MDLWSASYLAYLAACHAAYPLVAGWSRIPCSSVMAFSRSSHCVAGYGLKRKWHVPAASCPRWRGNVGGMVGEGVEFERKGDWKIWRFGRIEMLWNADILKRMISCGFLWSSESVLLLKMNLRHIFQQDGSRTKHRKANFFDEIWLMIDHIHVYKPRNCATGCTGLLCHSVPISGRAGGLPVKVEMCRYESLQEGQTTLFPFFPAPFVKWYQCYQFLKIVMLPARKLVWGR